MEDSGQAIELYSQANSLAPTDPSILTKLSNIYESEQDKTQAFQCLYDVIPSKIYSLKNVISMSELPLSSIRYQNC